MSRKSRTLKASPPGSTTWIYIEDDGSLVVEFYDHGKEAESAFGNDVAFLLKVPADQKGPLLEALRNESPEPSEASRPGQGRWWRRIRGTGGQRNIDVALLDELERRFGSYFEVRRWFDAKGVGYSHEFDSWA